MGRLQDQRIWLIGGALATLVIVALGWVMFIGPQLSSASELEDQTVASRQQNAVLESSIDSLRAKSTRLTRYTSSLNAALAALPYDSGLPAFTRQLSAQGRSSGVRVSSVVVGGVTPVAPPVAPTAAAGTSTATGTPTTSAAGGLFSIQVTIESNGPMAGQLAFLRKVRTVGPRRALVTSTQISPATDSGSASINRRALLSTQLTTFVAPRTPEQIRQLTKLANGDLER